MAKQKTNGKPQDDFDDAPEPQEARPAAVADEKAAMAARIAELEAQLAQEQAPARPAAPPGAGPYWQVQLEGAPTHVVEAPDSANAWDVYRHELGVLGSQHPPKVVESDREAYRAAQAKRHGMRADEFHLPGDPVAGAGG